MTYRALDYVIEQILASSHTVIYDAYHNRRAVREDLERLAAKASATPIVIWIKTPYKTAVERGQTREATADQRQRSEIEMKEAIARHMSVFDEPLETERVISIDGTAPFEKQYEQFRSQLKAILG